MGNIPDFNRDVNVQAVASQCFTRKNFEDFILKPLKLFYKKDDKGNNKTFKNSYDKMYLEIKEKIKHFPEKEVVNPQKVKDIQAILNAYKDEKSPNKLKYVQEMSNMLDATKINIGNVKKYLKMTQNDWNKVATRDICCYVQMLFTNDDLKEFQQAILNALTVLKENRDESEVKREHGDQFIQKYYKK